MILGHTVATGVIQAPVKLRQIEALVVVDVKGSYRIAKAECQIEFADGSTGSLLKSCSPSRGSVGIARTALAPSTLAMRMAR